MLPFTACAPTDTCTLDEIDQEVSAMLGFLEHQVLPEIGRINSAIKKRDNWAPIVAYNDVQELRVREESSIM